MDTFILEICKKYWRREGCRDRQCQRIHLCRFFLTFRCEGRKKSGIKCQFSHSLKDEHNLIVLQKAGRVDMTMHELKVAYKEQSSDVKAFRATSRMPEICKFYNGLNNGCKHNNSWESSCPCIHICRHYVLGDCKFGTRCKYSHNIQDPQPHTLLMTYGICVYPYNEKEVLDKLKDWMLEVEDHSLSISIRSEGKKPIKREIINDFYNNDRNNPADPVTSPGFNTLRYSHPNPFYNDLLPVIPGPALFNSTAHPQPYYTPRNNNNNILPQEIVSYLKGIKEELSDNMYGNQCDGYQRKRGNNALGYPFNRFEMVKQEPGTDRNGGFFEHSKEKLSGDVYVNGNQYDAYQRKRGNNALGYPFNRFEMVKQEPRTDRNDCFFEHSKRSRFSSR